MVKVKEDLTGKTFGRLTVLEQAEDYVDPRGEHVAMWKCKCACANNTILSIRGTRLKRGETKSCGCLQKEITAKNNKRFHKTNVYDLNLEDENGLYGVGYCSNTNREFYFDMDDYDKIKNYCWSEDFCNKNYSRVRAYDSSCKSHIFMHSIITHKYCDHIDRNTFNNRKHNLRQATNQENARNRSISKTSKSGFVGVNWIEQSNKWKAIIKVNGKTIYLGFFEEKEDAIHARLEAEAKYFGEFAPQRHLFEQYKINVKDGDINDLS